MSYRFDDAVLAKVERDFTDKAPEQRIDWRYPQAYGALGYYMQTLIDEGLLTPKGKKRVAYWLADLTKRA